MNSLNVGESLVYHASLLGFYDVPPTTPYTGPANWPAHLFYVVVNLRVLFGLPIVAWANCIEPGCPNLSVYDEPGGWRCFAHRQGKESSSCGTITG